MLSTALFDRTLFYTWLEEINLLAEVNQFIEENADLYIDWLQELCRQPSVAAQNRGMEETATLVEDLMARVGVQSEQVATSGYAVVYGTVAGKTERTLSFYNHYDVQPEEPLDAWLSDPFSAEIRDGRIYARGVADNKGNLVARLAAVHALQQTVGNLPVNVKFLVEGEEEIGSVHLAEFAKAHPEKVRSDGCIWEFGYKNPDGRLQVSLGVKGMCYVEVRVTGANTDLHSAQAAVIENPAWRLVWALSTLKNAQERILIEGFYDRVAPPSRAEVALLKDMIYEEDATLASLDLDQFVLGLRGQQLKEKLIFQPTCTICGLTSGYGGTGSKTVLPRAATAKLDFRLVPDQDPHDVLDALRRHFDQHGFDDIEIVPLSLESPAKTDLAAPLVQTVLSQAAEVYGQPPTVYRISPGTGPMHLLCQAYGIPAVSFGVGHDQSRNHAPNENIIVQNYIEGIKMVASVLSAFGDSA